MEAINLTVTRVADRQWHALEDDQVVGRGEAFRRSDGRTFLSIDAWHGTVFDRLAEAMLTELPTPLYTVVDEADADVTSGWTRAGFTTRRREWEYLVPTDPQITGLGSAPLPAGLSTLGLGRAEFAPLRELDRVVRADIEATVGWPNMPAEVVLRPDGVGAADAAKYAVAVQDGQYAGLLRLAPVLRQPRIGLIAVRPDMRRRGIARALLAEVLGALHAQGVRRASAEVHESNAAALTLFEGAGAWPAGSNLELVLR